MIVAHVVGTAAAVLISTSKVLTLIQDVRDHEPVRLWLPGAFALALLQIAINVAIWSR